WFFLVSSVWLFLALTTDALDTIPSGVVGLLAISAGTTLTAVAANKTFESGNKDDLGKEMPAVDLSLPREEIKEALKDKKSQLDRELDRLNEREGTQLSPEDKTKNANQIVEVTKQQEWLKKQIHYFDQPRIKAAVWGFFSDLVTEGTLVSIG